MSAQTVQFLWLLGGFVAYLVIVVGVAAYGLHRLGKD